MSNMLETKTLKEWMDKWRFTWMPGQEQFMKGELNFNEAADIINRFLREGVVRRG